VWIAYDVAVDLPSPSAIRTSSGNDPACIFGAERSVALSMHA
jgi:hypothetical protein